MNGEELLTKKGVGASLWGDYDTATLENRIFTMLMFMVFVVGLVQTALNLMIGEKIIILLLSLMAMFCGLALYIHSLYTKNYKPFVAPSFIFFLLVITAASFLDNGIKGTTPYLFFIPVIAVNIFMKNRERNYFIALAVMLIGVLIIAEYYFPQFITVAHTTEKALLMDLSITIFMTIGIIVAILRIVMEQQQKDREHLSKAYDEIEALKGFLPICSRCKKIRDDKGDWSKLEAYMKTKRNIEFTHGLCPDCLKSMMGEGK